MCLPNSAILPEATFRRVERSLALKSYDCTGALMQRNTRPREVVVRRKPVKERRRWPRLPLAIPVFVRGSSRQGNDILEFGTILNVSAGGVLFVSRKQARGSRVLLEIPTPARGLEQACETQRKFRMRILRTAPGDGRWHTHGGRFETPLRVARSEKN